MNFATINTAPQRIATVTPPALDTRISVFGLGYVGIVSTACFAQRAHQVIGVDAVPSKVEAIAAGRSPIVEPGLNEALEDGVDLGLITATQDVAAAVDQSDVSFVCVGTPSAADGTCDLTFLKTVCSQIGAALRNKAERHTVVIRSTIPPGTTRNLLKPILEKASGKTAGIDFGLGFHPEFLRECTAIEDFYAPPKTVVGALDRETEDLVAGLYTGIDDAACRISLEAAEMVKYVDNSWHAAKVAFTNEIGRISKACGVDSHEVMRTFVKDTKLNISAYYMKPGFAYGGSCLPKDARGMSQLADKLGVEVPMIEQLNVSNAAHIAHAADLVRSSGAKRIALLGLTFKPGTDDMRESPNLTLAQQLHQAGLSLRIYDPNVMPGADLSHVLLHNRHAGASDFDWLERALSTSLQDACVDADLIIIAHKTPENLAAAAARREDQTVLDLVRLADQPSLGKGYQGLCW